MTNIHENEPHWSDVPILQQPNITIRVNVCLACHKTLFEDDAAPN
jgi:hypothetical protein